MLDAFLEVACSKTKQAEARNRRVELLEQLPNETLMKIASGEEKLAYLDSMSCGEEWLEKFKGSPLLGKAIELAKQDLQLSIEGKQQQEEQDAAFRDHNMERMERRDDLQIQRKMLEIELASGESPEEPIAEEMAAEPPHEELSVEAPAGQPAAPQMGMPEAELPKDEEKPAPKPGAVNINMGKAAMAMRMKLAHMLITKEAFNPLPELGAAAKGIKGFAMGAGKNIASAAQSGGVKGALGMAKSVGADGMRMAGNYAKANPGMAAGMGAGVVGAGMLGHRMLAGQKTAGVGGVLAKASAKEQD